MKRRVTKNYQNLHHRTEKKCSTKICHKIPHTTTNRNQVLQLNNQAKKIIITYPSLFTIDYTLHTTKFHFRRIHFSNLKLSFTYGKLNISGQFFQTYNACLFIISYLRTENCKFIAFLQTYRLCLFLKLFLYRQLMLSASSFHFLHRHKRKYVSTDTNHDLL